jgi:cellulose synthase/poly-beta-1,6-N-acetylglucosamine synthase-like glycosyltransferase
MLLIVIGAVLAALALVPYGIYYLGILLGKKTEPVPALASPPQVSIIISAYNEEAVIRKRVENIAASRYPAGRYEVLFIDDCSSDTTLASAREAFAAAGMPHTIIHNEERLGTNVSYNRAIPQARYPVIVTTDADVFFRDDALLTLISRLMSDSRIAAACGELQPVVDAPSGTTRLEYAYRNYYGRMCSWESAVDSTYNFNGALVAFKKDLVSRINDKRGSDDANTAFEAIRRGFRAVYEPDAVVYEEIPRHFSRQYRQKIRRATRLIEATCANLDLLFKDRPFCRFFYPLRIFMVVASPLLFIAGLLVLAAGIFLYSPFLLLILAIVLVPVNFLLRNLPASFIFNQFYLLVGLLQTGRDMKTWESTSRKQAGKEQ